jgi:hypothetical protein
MRTILSRFLIAVVTVLVLGGSVSLTGCYAEEYRSNDGHYYRHTRWNGEHVYYREDGHWHARRHNTWIVVEGVRDSD